ncbi:MAG: hypothetical protein WCW14_02335 [Candidatus Paceibacterota bacterium]|jgi:hypothetical protein
MESSSQKNTLSSQNTSTDAFKAADSLGIVFHESPLDAILNQSHSTNAEEIGIVEEKSSTKPESSSGLGTIHKPNVEQGVVSFGPGVSEQNATHLGILRTYKGDIEDAIKTTGASALSVAVAENNRRIIQEANTKKENETPKRWNRALVGISIIIILVTIIIISAIIYISKPTPTTETQQIVVPSLISADSQKEINVTKTDFSHLMRTLRDQVDKDAIRLGTIEQIYITEGSSTTKKLLSSNSLVTGLGLHTGDSLIRSLDASFMFGIYSFNQNQPFLIFKTRSYETAFSGMLSWERSLPNDLQILFGIPNEIVSAIGNSNSGIAKFEDVVIRNKDVRVLKDKNGKIFMMYSIPDNETIIITTDEYTLKEILSRLSRVRVTQ